MPDSLLHKITHLSEKLGNSFEITSQLIKALDASPVGTAILDSNGRYVWLNKAHEEIFGYEHRELIGKEWKALYSEKSLEFFGDTIMPSLMKNKSWKGEVTGIKKDGLTEVHEMIYLTLLEGGGLICTCISINDK